MKDLRSTTLTLIPRRIKACAMKRPLGPAPITSTSAKATKVSEVSVGQKIHLLSAHCGVCELGGATVMGLVEPIQVVSTSFMSLPT